ncbi:MAG: nitronate monooxygenase [Erysipelothrix sp.]|jgi:enoyl-[acyl-carrier protein] reductase II|nr:nitronate monooxygenase [Erysipelothrix sp.]
MKTKITELFDIEFPIIQGGLAYLADAVLAAAVSNAGGLGQITATSLNSADALRLEINKFRSLSDKPFSVNYAISRFSENYMHLLEVAIELNVPIISITGGDPTPVFEKIKGTSIKTMVLVADVRQAMKAESLGADAIIAVGQEGGGHLGRTDVGTFVLIPRVVDSVSIPVIASGGIGDGRGLVAALALGAQGIEMGTRFIATKECVLASMGYKNDLVTAQESDTVVIKRTLKTPGRVLSSEYSSKILDFESQGYDYQALKEYVSGQTNLKYINTGDSTLGYGWAGQVVGLIEDIPSVQELFDRMMNQVKAFYNQDII